MKDFDLSPSGVLSPATSMKPKRAKTFSHARAYFVYDADGKLVACRIGKDAALIRTYHDPSLTYYVARNAEDARSMEEGGIPQDYMPRRQIGIKGNPAHQDRPCAAPGLASYRYPGSFGDYIMIGAKDHADALNEARRSLSKGVPVSLAKLEVWNGAAYVPASSVKANPFTHARPFGGSVGVNLRHIHFEDTKGVIYYFAGNTPKGVKLSRRFDEAMKFNPQRAAQLLKRLNRLYQSVRSDNGHFYAESAQDKPVKSNAGYRGHSYDGGYKPQWRREEQSDMPPRRTLSPEVLRESLAVNQEQLAKLEAEGGDPKTIELIRAMCRHYAAQLGVKANPAAQYVTGDRLNASDRAYVLNAYVHRFTGQHTPLWARKPRSDGSAYPVQFRDDADWLANTRFAVKADGRRDKRVNSCKSSPTWPMSDGVKPNPGFNYGVKHRRDTYDILSESALRDLIRQRNPHGYESLDDDGPADKRSLIEALRTIDNMELGIKDNPGDLGGFPPGFNE